MKFLIALCFTVVSVTAWSFSGDGMPFKYISSCEMDLNGDSLSDKAILLEGLAGRELIALIAKKTGYDTYVISTGKPHMFLSCKFGPEVKETLTGSGTGKTHKTPGAYLELIKPESSSVAYIWNNGKFKEVWTAD
jgi:hypothetical protein